MSRLVSESWLTAVGRAWLFEFLQQGFQVRGVKKKSKGRVQIKGAGRRAELEWEVCNSLDLLSLPVWGACFLPTSPKRKALCWKFHMWASRWCCKPSHRHLKVLVSFVSKVFFPAVLFFCQRASSASSIVLLRLLQEAGEIQSCRGRKGQGAKEAWGGWLREGLGSTEEQEGEDT